MLKSILKQTVGHLCRPTISVSWIRQDNDSWMARYLKDGRQRIRADRRAAKIERLSARDEKLGSQKVLDAYLKLKNYSGADTRTPSQVRCSFRMGNFFSHIVRLRRPEVIVEFGAAFGVSGMYWLSGLEANGKGKLLSFEPNEVWAAIAEKNLAAIGTRFKMIKGTFEENIDAELKEREREREKIDIALIDAIHTDAFVLPQFELVAERLAPGGLVLVDDIHFKGMNQCFDKIATDPRIKSSAVLCDHVGMVEFKMMALSKSGASSLD
jgi:predicted O-methyltransferase YrrM